MNILITLCARGGSKGIPGKNIKTINGTPLIGWSIKTAKAFAEKYPAHIALSTDDEQIKRVAADFGVCTDYTRPAELAQDNSGKLDAIADLLLYEETNRHIRYDYILDTDISSPLRTLVDLEAAFQILEQDADAMNLFSVNHANRNPYFNMVELQPSGYYGLVKSGSFTTRQSVPPVYDLNASFYFYRRAFFHAPVGPVINDRSLIYVMPHICFDLDHKEDFDIMEYLIVNNKLGFDL
jgi:CMP-N,N'-diacetyllegionaminic acid synthase